MPKRMQLHPVTKSAILFAMVGSLFANPVILQVKDKKITVNGKTATVLTIEQPDGTWGYYAKTGDNFDVIVENKLTESTVIHWHGLDLPNNQDGTELTQQIIPPGDKYNYNFKLLNTGTFWMHSHFELQEAQLAEAPLIIESVNDKEYQQVVLMFQDFSFKSPQKVLTELTGNAMNMQGMADMQGMDMGHTEHTEHDLNDVKYDAFLTNYHTPDKPQIINVTPGRKVKLRFINGSSSSNFWINLGKLDGTAVAIDGRDIKPYHAVKYQLSEGQRIDIVATVPKKGGVFPIIGQVEGLKNQTGLILSSVKTNATIPKFAAKIAPSLNDSQELQLHSLETLKPKAVDQVIKLELSGTMAPYAWQINGQSWPKITPLKVKTGSRVEIDFVNKSMMAHPMHLHGVGVKVIEVNGHKIDGAMRDTVLVLPNETVKVIFDAPADGKWFLHCHVVWHMHTGMMTYLEVTPS